MVICMNGKCHLHRYAQTLGLPFYPQFEPYTTTIGHKCFESETKKVNVTGETSIRNPMANNGNSLDSAFPTSRPSNASLIRSVSAVARDERRPGNSTRNRGVGTKADTWEKAQMAKIKKR